MSLTDTFNASLDATQKKAIQDLTAAAEHDTDAGADDVSGEGGDAGGVPTADGMSTGFVQAISNAGKALQAESSRKFESLKTAPGAAAAALTQDAARDGSGGAEAPADMDKDRDVAEGTGPSRGRVPSRAVANGASAMDMDTEDPAGPSSAGALSCCGVSVGDHVFVLACRSARDHVASNAVATELAPQQRCSLHESYTWAWCCASQLVTPSQSEQLLCAHASHTCSALPCDIAIITAFLTSVCMCRARYRQRRCLKTKEWLDKRAQPCRGQGHYCEKGSWQGGSWQRHKHSVTCKFSDATTDHPEQVLAIADCTVPPKRPALLCTGCHLVMRCSVSKRLIIGVSGNNVRQCSCRCS